MKITEMKEMHHFNELAREIKKSFEEEWHKEDRNFEDVIKLQKEAIIGKADAVFEFLEKIHRYIVDNDKMESCYPMWYENLDDAIFQENWGLAGLSEFFTEKYRECSSAKIIGERIYFLIDGRQRLMPQKIKKERRVQLVRALCMDDPKAKFDEDSIEVYMNDGTRITIYNECITKLNQDAIVVRRYIIPRYSLEMQYDKGTISREMVPLFKSMIALGYNVIFSGAVRTAKTSLLATWLSYENPILEGVIIGTDAELDLNKILPEAPILNIIADTPEKLRTIIPRVLRSDADYFCFPEARDGASLDIAVTVASKDTRRMKLTFHTRDPIDICHDIAVEIIKFAGGDLENTEIKVAKSFDYVFHMIQLKDKSKKRLKGIYEIHYDRKKKEIEVMQICRYIPESDSWQWKYHISSEKICEGRDENLEEFNSFRKQLEELERKYPMEADYDY